jgi:hypothetical protein
VRLARGVWVQTGQQSVGSYHCTGVRLISLSAAAAWARKVMRERRVRRGRGWAGSMVAWLVGYLDSGEWINESIILGDV